MSDQEPLQLTMMEAARRLSVGRRTLDDWRKDGLIETHKIGRLRFVPMSEVRRLARAGKGERATAAPVAGVVAGPAETSNKKVEENQRVTA